MYRCGNGQIRLADFGQPFGMNLKENNRWVKKRRKSRGRRLRTCIIRAEYGCSNAETALRIQENPYLQYFCGYPGYNDEKLPFDPSLMARFRKGLTHESLGEINEMIMRDESKDDDDGRPEAGGNSGAMIVDAACAPSNIRYPQDVCGGKRVAR